MDLLVVLLIIAVSIWSRAAKKKSETAKKLTAQNAASRQNAAAAAAAVKAANAAKAAKPVKAASSAPKAQTKPAAPVKTPLSFEAFEQAERDGSIVMPPAEPHEHEGKPLPCPAEERETPRPRPSQQAKPQKAAPRSGMQLSFSQNSMVQAVVMSEILTRPRFENGRRAIR